MNTIPVYAHLNNNTKQFHQNKGPAPPVFIGLHKAVSQKI